MALPAGGPRNKGCFEAKDALGMASRVAWLHDCGSQALSLPARTAATLVSSPPGWPREAQGGRSGGLPSRALPFSPPGWSSRTSSTQAVATS